MSDQRFKEFDSNFDTSARAEVSSPQHRLEFDVEKYNAYVAEMNLTKEEEEQLLKALWDIMMAFVDMGFGIHPVQEISPKKATKTKENCGFPAESVLYSDHSDLIKNNRQALAYDSAESESES